MQPETVGILHPGEMGATVAAAARRGGAIVLWAAAERSPATRRRAEAAGLEEAATVADLVARAGIVVSVCPPGAALDVAGCVAGLRFGGVFVDANAVSPDTAREIGRRIEAAGGRFVDGGIIGPPAVRSGTTRLYLSGREGERVASLFGDGPLEAIALAAPAGSASALKMAYAAYTKGTTALLAAIRSLAAAEGVDEALGREWALSQPDLGARLERTLGPAATKAWRFVGEMEEIAATFAAAGLPGGFHQAAAEIYARLARFKDAPEPSVDEVAAALRAARRR